MCRSHNHPRTPPRCPRCGRPVHRIRSESAPGGYRDLSLMPTVSGYTYGPHICLPPGARHGAPEINERRWTALDVIELFVAMDRRREKGDRHEVT